MLEAIINLLNIDHYYGVSENIEIAKGKYKLPMTFQEGWEQKKRLKNE